MICIFNDLTLFQLNQYVQLQLNISGCASGMLREIIMYSIIAVFIGISQSAGVGGGPVLNICLMIGANYSAKQSMAITYIFLMGGACASIIKNYNKIQQSSNTFIMDYNLVMITLPMIASGSLFGTLTNHFLSQLVITILFVFLLSYLVVNTYQKLRAYSTLNKLQTKSPLLFKNNQLAEISKNNEASTGLQAILHQELNPLPKNKILIIIFVFLYTLIILLVKGGNNYNSIIGLEKCGYFGDFLIVIHLLLGYILSKKFGEHAIDIDSKKEGLGFVFSNHQDKMTEKKVINSIIVGFGAGLIGGTLGLGGAIVLVPVWLNTGIDQEKSTSSSPPLIFFSALISFTICLLSGHYKSFMQLCFYFGLAYLGSAVVKSIIKIITQKYNLHSMVYILLLITLVLSLLTLLPYQIYKFYKNQQQFLRFGSYC